MGLERLQEDYILQQHEGRVQAALDSNKGMVDFSKMSLRGAMLLNGAAAVPIVYSKSIWLYSAAIWFGWGAFWAAVATGVTYLTQWMAFETWRRALGGNNFKISHVEKESREVRVDIEEPAPHWAVLWAKIFRALSILLVLASLFCFAGGLKEAYDLLDQRSATAAQETVAPPLQQGQCPLSK